MMKKREHHDDDDQEITEEMVEGIYIESRYKIENIPGYAEAFKRAGNCLRKVIDGGECDQRELVDAMTELLMIEMLHHHKINPP